MENTNNTNYWNKIKNNKKNKSLTFIHTPKCGGRFVDVILRSINVKNKNHHRAHPENDGITFTVIRDPIERFESLLNYRLGLDRPIGHRGSVIYNVWKDKSISLNEIVEKMTDSEILGFKPYNSLCYWSENVDIFITIDKLEEFLSFFGYKIDITKYQPKNVSLKIRGTFNEATKKRISNLYSDDIVLYRRVIID